MNSAFALVLTVFLVSGEPVDIAVSVHRTMQECMTAATEQKIPGNCRSYERRKIVLSKLAPFPQT
ncbi:DUF1482 family protein [Escherichia coli]|nr:DUF1482 family protein [Escherichia coli]